MNKILILSLSLFAISAHADFDDRLKQLEVERKIRDIEYKADWDQRERQMKETMRDYEERSEKHQREIDEIIDESNQTRFELEMQHRLNELKE
jgi:hypothetical protein